MNEQLVHHDFSGDLANSTLNTTLISMQIQALRESLRRLTDSEEAQIERLDNDLENQQTKPIC